jgi:hypothetical protein
LLEKITENFQRKRELFALMQKPDRNSKLLVEAMSLFKEEILLQTVSNISQ